MFDKEKLTFNKLLKWALLLSFIFHLGIVGYKYDFLDLKTAPKVSENKRKKIRIKIRPKKEEKKKEEAKKKVAQKQKKKIRKRQIVESEKSLLKDKSKPQTRFLSENTQNVDRQTIARRIDKFKEAGKGEKTGVETLKKNKTVAKSSGKKNKKTKRNGKKKITFADLAVGKNTPDIKQVITPKGIKSGKEGLSGLAQNNDYIDDVPMGDFTKLNTVEFKYYGFYHRIKQKLEQHWGFQIRQKAKQLYRKGRKIASKDNITALAITLDTKGNIVDIQIKSTSGVQELDDAAIESFNKAGPFPNPPAGMMKNGLATIEWGFVVKS